MYFLHVSEFRVLHKKGYSSAKSIENKLNKSAKFNPDKVAFFSSLCVFSYILSLDPFQSRLNLLIFQVNLLTLPHSNVRATCYTCYYFIYIEQLAVSVSLILSQAPDKPFFNLQSNTTFSYLLCWLYVSIIYIVRKKDTCSEIDTSYFSTLCISL